MVVLKSIEQLRLSFNNLLNGDGVSLDEINMFMNTELDEESIEKYGKQIKDLNFILNDVEIFSSYIFQLKNYIYALGNFVKILLISKNFEAIYHFITKLFINQIGQIRYQSKNNNYSFIERYFDRFVEIIKNCNIDPKLYLPFILETFVQNDSSFKLKNWNAPAIEFLQSFYMENEELINDYIQKGFELKYEILETLALFNTTKSIATLISDNYKNKNFDLEKNLHILKNFKRETIVYIDKNYSRSNDEDKLRMVKIFLSFMPDNEALTRLKEIYNNETKEDIKHLISINLGITDTLSIKTEKQFLYAVRRKIKEPQERTLGIKFENFNLNLKSGFKSDNNIFTFLIFLFKEEKNLTNIKKLLVLNNIFEEKGLIEMSEKLFESIQEKIDILQAKWAIRMISLFCDKLLLDNVISFNKKLYNDNRIKEAKYFTECLISAGKDDVLTLLRDLLTENNEFVIESKEYFIELFAKRNDISTEEVRDNLVIDKDTIENYEAESNRLFLAYINGRDFSVKYFKKIFLENNFLSQLAQRLVFGEYGYGRLYNAFIIKDGEINYIVKTGETDKMTIKIIHPIDLDYRFDKVLNEIKNPLFEQFRINTFNINKFPQMSVSINRFNGIFVDVKMFVENLKRADFKINNYENEIYFSSLVYLNTQLEILAEVEFEKNITIDNKFVTIGQIYFYKLNDIIMDKGKFITQKTNAISIGGVPYRFFDFVLNAVSESSKSKK